MNEFSDVYRTWTYLGLVLISDIIGTDCKVGLDNLPDATSTAYTEIPSVMNKSLHASGFIFGPLKSSTYDPRDELPSSIQSLSSAMSSSDLSLARRQDKEVVSTTELNWKYSTSTIPTGRVQSTDEPDTEQSTGYSDLHSANLLYNGSVKTGQATIEPHEIDQTTFKIVDEDMRPSNSADDLDYSNRTDHCGYYFSDKSCPWPTVEEMQQIDAWCESLEIQMDTIYCISLAFGLPGSILVVVTVSSMSVNPSTLYMKVLAVSDFLALLLGAQIFKMPNEGTFTIEDMRPMWLCRVFQAFSHWILALTCLERFICVQYPMQKSRIYTMRNAKLTVGAAFVVSAVPFVWSCIHYSVHVYRGNMVFHLNVVHNLIYSLVPGIFIVIFSTLTFLQLRNGAKLRRSMSSRNPGGKFSRLDAVLTRLMFAITICFIVINSPWGVIHVYDNVRILFCPLIEAIFSFFYYGCLSFTFVNHTINFYVYCTFAKDFRNRFWRVIRCRQKSRTYKAGTGSFS